MRRRRPSPRRQASTTSASEARSAATSSRRSACSPPATRRRAAGRSSAARASATSARSAGTRARSAASCARASAVRAAADAQRAQRQLGRGQLGHRRQRRRQAARIEPRQRGRGLVEAAEQQQPARRDQPRLQRVGAIGVRLERRRRRRQRARRAAEVAHGQRHLGLGDDAAGARQLLVGAEAAGGAPQEFAGARVLAELGHGDAAQGQRRRVVAQRNPLERAERVAGGERARGGGDQGVHDDRLHRCADAAPSLKSSSVLRLNG